MDRGVESDHKRHATAPFKREFAYKVSVPPEFLHLLVGTITETEPLPDARRNGRVLSSRQKGSGIKEIAVNSKSIAPNPYDYIYEVTNPNLFAGRREELAQLEEEVAKLAEANPVAPMVAIVGERRIGKTSASLRVLEACQRYQVMGLRVSLTDVTAADPWEFWQETFYRLLTEARTQIGVGNPNSGAQPVTAQFALDESQLGFFNAYDNRAASVPPNHLIYGGLRSLVTAITGAGQNGVLFIVDEAHLLVSNHVLTQQLRYAIREAGRCGMVFVGETDLAQLFADEEQPLFAQGRVIPLNNFSAQTDIAECALLPLTEEERPLVSPMTIDYLVKLSQGKPNQIRLICHSIYNRYRKGQQTDLNITIETLDDVLDSIAATYTEYDVRQKVESIRRLSSVDLESLYNMTRYPNWAIKDIVDLDESFRAEGKSLAASSRREATLRGKHNKFVELGLMNDDQHQYTLAGDEFLALYLRFWYEIQKHGALSRSLVLGKGPATPFGEKTEKLVRFITWELKRQPAIVMNTFSPHDLGSGDRIEAVKARFNALDDLVCGTPIRMTENLNVLHEWFRTCQPVRKPGPHHLLCLSVRNLENPRETIGIELYFDSAETPLIVPGSILSTLRQRADDSKILVDAWDNFSVELPSLSGLVEAIGGMRLEELMAQVNSLERWRIASIQRHVGNGDEVQVGSVVSPDDDNASDNNDEEQSEEWVKLYENGGFPEAEKSVIIALSNETERHKSARLYNDLGYIRYRLGNREESKQDLRRALDLHYYHLPLTLSNLGVAYLDEGNYEEAIRHICDAIFLTFSAEDVAAGYLRLRLPTGHRATQAQWEQHPANVLEASYINLSFALLQLEKPQEASDVLREGLELMPSSARLKHASARLHLSLKRVDLAEPIYRDIAQQPISDPVLANEVRAVLRTAPRQRSRRRTNN